MTKIDKFDGYDRTFKFEPPIEVGEHPINSLGRLAAIASTGPDAHPRMIDITSDHIDHSLDLLHRIGATAELPGYLQHAASTGENDHKVTVE